MKKIVLLLLTFLITLQIQAQENEITTYYFIRHAEKERTDETNKNPHLNESGALRAEYWSAIFENIAFDAIYSTEYNRTIETVTPTSKNKNLEIQLYNPEEMYSEDFKLNTKGKTVLIVGHSNTTPMFVNKVLGIEKYDDIDDRNNSNLYIVTISNAVISDALLKIEH